MNKKAVSNIIGEVILVAFTITISLGYLAYMNSVIEAEKNSAPPPILAHAYKNNLYLMWFEKENNTLKLVLGERFNDYIKTIITPVGVDVLGAYKPLHILKAEAFTSVNNEDNYILVSGKSINVSTISPGDLLIMENNKYIHSNEIGITDNLDAVELTPSRSIILLNVGLENNINQVLIVAATMYNGLWIEYSTLKIDVAGGE